MVTQRGRVIYFASPIFHAYRTYGNSVYKALLLNALHILLPDPLLQTGLPSGGEATVLSQAAGPSAERLVCHLIYYVPQRRATRLDIVEDTIPLFDVPLAARTSRKPSRVYLAPQKEDLPFDFDGRFVRTRVPRIDGHQIVVIE